MWPPRATAACARVHWRQVELAFWAVECHTAVTCPSQVELAFWAGLEKFHSDNFKLGDPAAFLHPPDHPHQFAPQFKG